MEVLSAVVVAVIMGGPAWLGIRALRRENSDQHAQAHEHRLREHQRVEERLDELMTAVVSGSSAVVTVNTQLFALQERTTSALEEIAGKFGALDRRLRVLETRFDDHLKEPSP